MANNLNRNPAKKIKSEVRTSWLVFQIRSQQLRQLSGKQWQTIHQASREFIDPRKQKLEQWSEEQEKKYKKWREDRDDRMQIMQGEHLKKYGPSLRQARIKKIGKMLGGEEGQFLDAYAARSRSSVVPQAAEKIAHLKHTIYGYDRFAPMFGLPSLAMATTPIGLLPLPLIYKQAQKIENRWYHYQDLANYYVNRLPASYASGVARKAGLGVIRGGLETVGNALGLTKYTYEVDPLSPFKWKTPFGTQQQVSPFATFRPAYAARRRYAKNFENIANSGRFGLWRKDKSGNYKKILGLGSKLSKDSHFRVAAANVAKKKRQKGAINPLAFIFIDLIGGFLFGAGISFLESKVWGMGMLRFARGYLKPMARAIPSLSSISGAHLGHRLGQTGVGQSLGLGKNISLPGAGELPVNPAGIIGGGLGWYYQTILNMARDYRLVPAGYLMPNSPFYLTADAINFRNTYLADYEAITINRSVDFTKDPFAVGKIEKSLVGKYRIKHTNTVLARTPRAPTLQGGIKVQIRPDMRQLKAWNEKNLINNKVVNKVFNTPARWLRNPLARLPLRGIALATALQIPMTDPLWYVLVGGDYLLQVTQDLTFFKNIQKSALFGGIIGAQIASLYGLPVLPTVAIGAGASIGIDIFKNFGLMAEMETHLAPGNYLFRFTNIPHAKLYGQGFRHLEIFNKSIPYLKPTDVYAKLLTRFDRFSGVMRWSGRYLQSGAVGAGLGITAAWIFAQLGITAWWAQPEFLAPVGSLTGMGIQYLAIHSGAEGIPGLISSFLRGTWTKFAMGFGRVMGVFSGVMAGAEGTSYLIDWAKGRKVSLGDSTGEAIGKLVFLGLGVVAAIQVGGLIGGAAIILSGGALEIISRIAFHRSIFDLIYTRITYTLKTLGLAVPKIGQALIGFALGLLQAFFARDIKEMGTGAATASISLAMAGTGVITIFIIGSAFFTPAEKGVAISNLFSTVTKSGTYLPATKQLQYNMQFLYEGEKDAQGDPVTGGPSINGDLTSVQFLDAFDKLSYANLIDRCDIKVTFSGDVDWIWDSISCPTDNSPIQFQNFDPRNTRVPPNTLITSTITLQLKDDLKNILQGNILCNNFNISAQFPSGSVFYNQAHFCMDEDGNPVKPASSEFAELMVKALRSTCCGDLYANDSTCQITQACFPPDISQLLFREEIFKEYFWQNNFSKTGSNNQLLHHVFMLLADSARRHTYIQCVGFVWAHQLGVGHSFGPPTNGQDGSSAADWINGPPKGYEWHPKGSGWYDADGNPPQEGDIVLYSSGYAGGIHGHMAIVTSTDFDLGGNTIYVAEAHGNNGTITDSLGIPQDASSDYYPYYAGFLRYKE